MTHVFGLFLIGVTLGVQKVGEEYHLDDDKENKQLDADNQPQGFAHSHAAESIVVQVENTRPESLLIVITVTHGERQMKVNNLQN